MTGCAAIRTAQQGLKVFVLLISHTGCVASLYGEYMLRFWAVPDERGPAQKKCSGTLSRSSKTVAQLCTVRDGQSL